jgi:DNA-binding Lrp family transcriptional regulator
MTHDNRASARTRALDLRILRELVANPRVPVAELADRLGVVRNTAQSSLDRLHRSGVLGNRDRGVDLGSLGLDVHAVIAIEVRHSLIDRAVEALSQVPHVLLVEEVAGPGGDLVVRVAAHSNSELQAIVHAVHACEGVERTVTSVVLATRVPWRVAPLLSWLEAASTGDG